MKKIFVFLLFFSITFLNVLSEGNYVTSITIDGVAIEGFDSNKTDYELKVDSNKDNVKIVYTYDKDIYQANGSYGDVSLEYGRNEKTFTLTNKDDNNDKRTYKLIITREDARSGDNSLASLIVAGNKVILNQNNDYNVSVDSKLTSAEVKATLSNGKASFVDGYGERIGSNAVVLTGETTGVEIKVKAENGEIRTYKINIVKTNYKSNDATLKELKVEGIDFNFNPTTYEYELAAKSDIQKVKIKATLNDNKASLNYKEEVELTTGENIIEIKVTAEDGTEKIYKLKITREEEKPLVADIKIKDVEFTFNPQKYSYTIETELTTLDIDITLNKTTSKYDIDGNKELKNGSIIKIVVTDEDETNTNEKKTVTYKLKIKNNNEDDIETVTQTTGTNFFKQNEMIIGLAAFGIGLLSLLVVILLKPKSQIM